MKQQNTISGQISESLAEGCAWLTRGALRVAAEGLAKVKPGRWRAIQSDVGAGRASLTVQVDLPSGAVRVLSAGL